MRQQLRLAGNENYNGNSTLTESIQEHVASMVESLRGLHAGSAAAFELAAQIPVKGGLYLHEVLALRDLKVLVLDKLRMTQGNIARTIFSYCKIYNILQAEVATMEVVEFKKMLANKAKVIIKEYYAEGSDIWMPR